MDFSKDFKYLKDDSSVFNEITYDDFEDIIREQKTSLFVVGGPWSDEFQAVVSEVNKVAKEIGVKQIDVYDTQFVDDFGETVDLRDCLTLEHKLNYYFIVEHTGFKNPDELVKDTLIAKMYVPTFFAIKDGVCVDYFTSKYVKDSFIHLPGESKDMTVEFMDRFKELALKLK